MYSAVTVALNCILTSHSLPPKVGAMDSLLNKTDLLSKAAGKGFCLNETIQALLADRGRVLINILIPPPHSHNIDAHCARVA